MTQGIAVAVALAVLANPAFAITVAINPEQIGPDPTVVTFETGSSLLPDVPGLTWLQDRLFPISQWPRGTHWFGSAGAFDNLYDGGYDVAFGAQALVTLIGRPGYSDAGIDFAVPVQTVGAWVRGTTCCSTSVVEFRVLDAALNVLASELMPLDLNTSPMPFLFAGFFSTEGIGRVEWRVVGDPWEAGAFMVDNVTFGSYQAVVPVPGTILQLASAAGLLLFLRRRFS